MRFSVIVLFALVVVALLALTISTAEAKKHPRHSSAAALNKPRFTNEKKLTHRPVRTLKKKKAAVEQQQVSADSQSMISNGATLQATTTLNVRSGPCTTNSVVKQLTNGQTATYTGQTSSGCGYTWYSISGGWVASNYVNVVGGGGGDSGGSGKGDIAAKFARQQVGKCYSQAGNLRYGPTCFDCSGLVYMAWKNAGVNIGATWTGAYPGNTRKVSLSEIKTGDILHRDGHVGMYVGNGEVVNAENEKNGVRLRSLSGFRYTTIYRPL